MDFIERQRARVTFEKRHLPLSDGEDHPEFEGLVPEPEAWTHTRKPKETRNKVRRKEVDLSEKHEVTQDEDPVVMIFDDETNKLVPLVTVE